MIAWYLTVLLLVILLGVTSFYCLRFAMIVLKIQESIQMSVDVIDEKHQKITEILSRPLFYDSPEVRQVLKDIDDVRESLSDVARDLTKDFDEKKKVKEST